MKLLKLEGEYFAQYKKLGPIYFPDKGIIGILGRNGAGKSTIFNAIELALYGNITGVKASEIKNQDAKKSQKWWVELVFEMGEFQYKVFRHENTAKAYLSVNGKTIQLGQTDVTEHITSTVLQMDQIAFSNAFYGKQDEFDNLNKLTNEQRKKEISKLLRFNNIDKAIDALRIDKNVLNTQITEQTKYVYDEEMITKNVEELTVLISKLIEQDAAQKKVLDDKEKSFSVLKERISFYEKKSEQYTELLNKHNNIASNVKMIQDTILPSIDKQINEITILKEKLPELVEMTKDIPILEQKEQTLNQQKTNFEQHKMLLEQNQQNKVILTNKKVEIDSLVIIVENVGKDLSVFKPDEEARNIQVLTDFMSATEEKLSEITSNLSVVISKGKENKDEVTGLKNLGEKSTCPTCQQVLGKHLESIISKLELEGKELISQYKLILSQKEELEKVLKSHKIMVESSMKLIFEYERKSEELLRNKAELERIRSEFSPIRAQFISLEARIKEFSQTTFDPNELTQLKDKLKLLYQTQEKIKHIENSIQKVPALMQEKESKLVEISTLQTELKNIKQQGIDLNFNKNDFIKVKEYYDASFNEMRILEKEYSSISSSLYSAKKDLDVFNQTIEKNKENLVLLNSRKTEFKTLLYLEEVYKNYKIERLSKLAPTISTIMKNLLIQLTDGKYDLVELDEHFNVFVYRNHIRQPLHLFSGGEKKLISLVQRLAISHIIVSKTSKKKFEYLGLDEVLGSMDEERQESILEGLRRLNDIFKQIVIVSHNSNLNELFDYTLRISQNADLSSSLSWDEDWDEEQIMNKII